MIWDTKRFSSNQGESLWLFFFFLSTLLKLGSAGKRKPPLRKYLHHIVLKAILWGIFLIW